MTHDPVVSDPDDADPDEGDPEEEDPEADPPVVVARIDADALAGTFPLAVSFDASASELASESTRFEWSFGDGAVDVGIDAVHTFIGAGSFETTLVVIDDATGAVSEATTTIDVSPPPCPSADPTLVWGHVDDTSLTELSGIATSARDPEVYWVHEDSGSEPLVLAIDQWGATIGEYTLPDEFSDFEDLKVAVDPATGTSTLFLGDIGNNGHDRDEVAVWIVAEPDPWWSSSLDPVRMGLDYPDGQSLDSETLLVDPLTFDLYLVSKEYEGPSNLFVKRAPHVEGSFELEDLGELPIEITATGGDVSPDGTRIVIRDYSPSAWLWVRDGYLPLEDALLTPVCEIDIAAEPQGEAIAFTADGVGLVTVSEGTAQPLNYTEL